METELKLQIMQSDVAEKILADPWIRQLIMPGSERTIEMDSLYFDTIDGDLNRQRATLRIRQEGNHSVLTIKTGGKAMAGLHQRLEWSVDLTQTDWDPDLTEGLDAARFMHAAISDGDPDDQLRELLDLIGRKPLIKVCQAVFTRRAYDIGYGDTLMEMALDRGHLIAGDRTEAMNELELELKEGDVRDLMALGEDLMGQYPLVSETLSKYARCLLLMNKGQEDVP